jgi:hypothetical protein
MDRIENPTLLPQINELYRTWGLLHNFFCPTLKLESKTRVGAKTIRKYGPPQTPYERLCASPHLTSAQKEQLRARCQQLNPLHLKAQLEEQLKNLFRRLQAG